MPTIVRAADAAQFLSLVPRLLGFVPARSLVVVPMCRGRSLGAMRVDLPSDPTPGPASDTVAATVVGLACRIADADGAMVVVYTDAAVTGILPHRALVESLSDRAEACGLPIADALVVGANGWGSYLDRDLPPGGHPLTDLVAHDGPGSLPAPPTGDQASGAALPKPDDAARAAVAQAARALDAALAAICGIAPSAAAGRAPAPRIDPAALEAACELDDLPALFEQVLDWDPARLAAMRAAMLGWCLGRPALRDVALVQWASDQAGGDVAMDAQRKWEDGAEYPSDLASVMWGEGRRPDPERLERALEVARVVAALLPKRRRAGTLAVCGWLAWALGRSTHADRYAAQALRIERGHGLAEIVRSFVAAGHLPDWAFRPA
ncbi:DUF4192 family protein [Microbacterium sp.]|uniref:DUF4192 family protein n=1 Tax=Microbacterium sp. TaxID=51671 RepID=UPI00289855EB|nr:DUF4192 family protein [Microbacterium sp.]